MDVFELIDAVGAEIAANRAVARVDGERVVVAKVIGDKMVLTAEGEELAKVVKPAPAPAPKATKTTKSKTTKAAATPKSDE
jgi:hypothetical protein